MEHENDPDIDEPYVPPAGNVLGGVDSQSTTEQPTLADTAEGQAVFCFLGEGGGGQEGPWQCDGSMP